MNGNNNHTEGLRLLEQYLENHGFERLFPLSGGRIAVSRSNESGKIVATCLEGTKVTIMVDGLIIVEVPKVLNMAISPDGEIAIERIGGLKRGS